jgi:hypothetical protein
VYHVHGAVFAAQTASDARVRVDGHDTVPGLCDGTHGTHLHAVGIFTLAAHHGQVIQVLCFRVDGQPGPSGIVPAGHGQAACQLTDPAPGASVKMDMDKGVDGALSFRFDESIGMKTKQENNTYYVLCKYFFS